VTRLWRNLSVRRSSLVSPLAWFVVGQSGRIGLESPVNRIESATLISDFEETLQKTSKGLDELCE
jgi:hypothetical protein